MNKALIFAALVVALPVQAETYKSKFGSSIVLDGDSSVHKWKAESKLVGGTFEVDAEKLATKGKLEANAKVFIPVRSLKSGKKRMDEVMHAAMNAAKHSKIEFSLNELTVKAAKGTLTLCDSKGSLTINGKKKPIVMPVTIARADAKLTVKGSIVIKMTDFGITPPSPKLPSGNIVTKDEVKVSFSWVTAK